MKLHQTNLTKMISIQLLQVTQDFWDIEFRGAYHEIVSLVISQRITFKRSRKIRSNLYSKIGSNVMTYDQISNLTDDDLEDTGLDNKKIAIIRSISKDVTKEQFENIAGIGDWTIKSFLIQTEPNEYHDILLVEDLWIRSHLATLFDLNPKMTTKQAELLFQNEWVGYKTAVTKFLWRLSKCGALRLKNGCTLDRGDFI